MFYDILAETFDLYTLLHIRPPVKGHAEGSDEAIEIRWGGDRFYDRRLLRAWNRALDQHQPDLVWIEHFYSVPMLTPAARRRGIPIVYNAHNVEADRFQGYGRVARLLATRYERKLLQGVDHTVCVSDNDRHRLCDLYGIDSSRVIVLRNGYDQTHFRPFCGPEGEHKRVLSRHGIGQEGPVALFAGSYHYRPNADALHCLLTTLAPDLARRCPELTIAFVGPGLPPLNSPPHNVIAIGEVEDVVPYLQAADFFLCPLRFGGGSRLKIIEALACGLPVLSTDAGAEGLEDLGEESGLFRAPLATLADRVATWLDTGLPCTSHSGAMQAYTQASIAQATRAFVQTL